VLEPVGLALEDPALVAVALEVVGRQPQGTAREVAGRPHQVAAVVAHAEGVGEGLDLTGHLWRQRLQQQLEQDHDLHGAEPELLRAPSHVLRVLVRSDRIEGRHVDRVAG